MAEATTDSVRASYAANSWDFSHPEEDSVVEDGITQNYGRPGYEKFDRWLRAERARVWAEGAKHGFEDYRGKFDATIENVLVGNPYKEED